MLLDVMMPNMTAISTMIRKTWKASELPIVLLTAKNQISDLVIGLEMGANDYLTKPASKDELIARIKTHINLKHLKMENLRMAELEVTCRLQRMLLPKRRRTA
ncbi:MAG: response regulator [Thiotrichaceae bacterium]